MENWLFIHFLSLLPGPLSFYTALENNTIFLQQFFRFRRGGGEASPLPPWGRPWFHSSIQCPNFYISFFRIIYGILYLKSNNLKALRNPWREIFTEILNGLQKRTVYLYEWGRIWMLQTNTITNDHLDIIWLVALPGIFLGSWECDQRRPWKAVGQPFLFCVIIKAQCDLLRSHKVSQAI